MAGGPVHLVGEGSWRKVALDLLVAWGSQCSLGAFPLVDLRAVGLEWDVVALGCSVGGGAVGACAVGCLSSSFVGALGCGLWMKWSIMLP